MSVIWQFKLALMQALMSMQRALCSSSAVSSAMSRVAHSADSHGHGHAAAAVPAGEVRLPRDKFLRLPDVGRGRLTPSLLRPRSAARGVPVRPRGEQHGPLQAAVERPPVRSVAAIAALACARRRTPPSPGSLWRAFVALPSPLSLPPSLSFRRLLRLDALSPGTTVGPTARFASEETVYRQLRERACTRRVVARLARAGRALPRRVRPPPPPLATPPARPHPLTSRRLPALCRLHRGQAWRRAQARV